MIVLLLILGLLPGFAWLVFYVEEEETHPEPRRLILIAFAAGMASGWSPFFLKISWRARERALVSGNSRSRHSPHSRLLRKP